jgi:hypothetical protein
VHERPAGIEDAERDGAQWFVTVNDITPGGWRSMLAALHAVSAPLVAGSGPLRYRYGRCS